MDGFVREEQGLGVASRNVPDAEIGIIGLRRA
jgi:hypothetical protein